MAIIINGILGGFVGRVGNIIGYRSKGIYYIRQAPHKSEREPSAAQKVQHEKFRMAMAFIAGLRGLLKQMPDRGKKQVTAFNYLFGMILKKAIKGSCADLAVDYGLVRLSSGKLSPGSCHKIKIDSGRVLFSACLSKTGVASLNATLLVFNVMKQCWLYDTVSADVLGCGSPMDLPCDFAADQLEAWMFLSTNGFKRQSETIYLGSHIVPGKKPCYSIN